MMTRRAVLIAVFLALSVAACQNPNSHPYEDLPRGHGGGGGNR